MFPLGRVLGWDICEFFEVLVWNIGAYYEYYTFVAGNLEEFGGVDCVGGVWCCLEV